MSELSTLPLEKVMLAVLAACGSADGPVARGGTPLSFARPFLAQGVPNVVASLWPVADRATRRLLTGFYTHLAQGAAPAEALRDAQLESAARRNRGLPESRLLGALRSDWRGFTGSDETRRIMNDRLESQRHVTRAPRDVYVSLRVRAHGRRTADGCDSRARPSPDGRTPPPNMATAMATA